jgi:hypothetical protein
MTFRLRTTGGYARPLPQPAVFEQPCSLLPIVAPVSSAPKALVAPWALTMLRLRREVQPALREGHGSFIADNIPVPELPLDGMRIVSFERHGAPAKPPVLSERLPDWKRPTAAPRCARILFPDLPERLDHQPQSLARELASESHDSEKIDLPAVKVTPTRCAHPRLLAFVLGLSPSSTLLPG